MPIQNNMAIGQHKTILIFATAVASLYSVIALAPPVFYHYKMPDQWLYLAGRSLCHQRPSSCIWFFNAHTALCGKCCGFYLSVALCCAVSLKNAKYLSQMPIMLAGMLAFSVTLLHSLTNHFGKQIEISALESFVCGAISAVGLVGLVNFILLKFLGGRMEFSRKKCTATIVVFIAFQIFLMLSFANAQDVGGNGKTLLVPAGTPVILELMGGITAKETKEGDTIPLRVKSPVRIKDTVIINAGTTARGVVTLSRSASSWGGAGELQLDARSVSAVDGSEILLTGLASRKGDTSHGASAAVAVGAGLLCLPLALTGAAVKGEEGEIRTGYEIVARTMTDTSIRILTEEERIKILQQQIQDGNLLQQKIQDEQQKREEERKKKQQQQSTDK